MDDRTREQVRQMARSAAVQALREAGYIVDEERFAQRMRHIQDGCDCSPECRRLLSIRMGAFSDTLRRASLGALGSQLAQLNRLARERLDD